MWLELPDEVKEYIIKFMDCRTIRQLYFVCTEYRQNIFKVYHTQCIVCISRRFLYNMFKSLTPEMKDKMLESKRREKEEKKKPKENKRVCTFMEMPMIG